MKPNKIATALMLFAGLALAGCGKTGNGVSASDSRSVPAFTQVEAHGAVALEASVGSPSPVVLTGDENLLPLIETRVEGDTLIIRPTEAVSFTLPLTATISAADFTAIRLHGASKLNLQGIDNDAFTLESHGASSATLRGKTNKLALTLHGASKIDAQGMPASDVTVEAHGASSVELDQPETLDAELHGASNVTHGGSPKVTKDLHGSSSVKAR